MSWSMVFAGFSWLAVSVVAVLTRSNWRYLQEIERLNAGRRELNKSLLARAVELNRLIDEARAVGVVAPTTVVQVVPVAIDAVSEKTNRALQYSTALGLGE